MSKIEIGEYVKTKAGIIDKVDKTIGMIENTVHLENSIWIGIKDIVKHSKNLIDLVEKGDLVNGEKVVGIVNVYNSEEKLIGKRIKTEYRTAQYTGLDNRYYLYERDIKTILTHQRYEQNSYKVEG